MKNKVIKLSLAALLASTCAAPLSAASFKAGDFDLTLGGSVRLDAGYQQSDLGDKKLINPAAAPGAADYGLKAPEDRKLDYFTKLPTNNRLKLGAARENLNAYIELGFGPSGSTSGADAVKTRHAYLTYTSGAHSLLIGQTDIPLLTEKASQVLDDENGLCGYGDLDLSRRSQIKYTYKSGKMSFETALADNYVKNDPKTVGSGVALTKYQVNESTPALAARLTYKGDRLTVAPGVYWQRFDYKGNSYDTTASTPIKFDDLRAQAYIVGLDASIKLEPVKISAEAWYGQNPYLLASTDKRTASDITYKLGQPVVAVNYTGASSATADLQDVTAYGCWLMLSGDIGKNTVNLGAGYESGKVETGLTTAASKAQYRDKLITRGAFVNVKVPVKGGFFVQPEVAYYDHGTDANRQLRGLYNSDLGSELFAGIHFQYDF